MPFDHQRLDVYRAAIELIAGADALVADLPRGRSYLCDQLRRAATSVPLNIAEGAGEYSRGDKARFYRIAPRSATECAALLDVMRALQLVEVTGYEHGIDLLHRIVAMLTRMAKRLAEAGTGPGPGPEAWGAP